MLGFTIRVNYFGNDEVQKDQACQDEAQNPNAPIDSILGWRLLLQLVEQAVTERDPEAVQDVSDEFV